MLEIKKKLLTNRLYSSIVEEMKKFKIIPDVISKAPSDIAEIVYLPGHNKVDLGNILTPTIVKTPPRIRYDSEPGAFYTICMTDPDVPSRENPIAKEWHHWLVANIPGRDVQKGQTLSEYIGAAPLYDSGLHRYVFLIYKQNNRIDFDEPHLTDTSSENRGGFSIESFAIKYKLGELVAGNFFRAEWDSYVPAIFKQIGSI